jgi:hypothetical protein
MKNCDVYKRQFLWLNSKNQKLKRTKYELQTLKEQEEEMNKSILERTTHYKQPAVLELTEN